MAQLSKAQYKIVFVIIGGAVIMGAIVSLTNKFSQDYELKHYGVKVYAKILNQYKYTYRSSVTTKTTIRYKIKSMIVDEKISVDTAYHYTNNDSLIMICSWRSPQTYSLIGIRMNGKDHLQAH
jgi:hypothetical protein